MAGELELKFGLPASLQDRLERDGTPDRCQRVRSCYYDTPDGELTRARTAVRVRLHGERWVQTVKADTGDRFERFEWERPVAGPAPERDALPPESTPQGALVRRSFGRWQPLFETDFERCARRIDPAPGLAIELARDVGEVRCGALSEPIRELELERMEGTRAAFFAWALDWADREGACLVWPTKNERGLRLAGRLPAAPEPVRADASAAAPGPDASSADSARAVLHACIGHACANIEPILASEAAEGPHQLRVALRRLRAALRFFDLRGRDAGAWRTLDREAAALAALAGRVRDLDVLESGLLARLRARLPEDAALATLARALAETRHLARADLRRALAGSATTLLVLRALALAEGLASGAGPARPDAPARADAQGPAEPHPGEPHPAEPRPGDPRPADPPPAAGPGPAVGDLAGFAQRRIGALLRRVRKRAACAADAAGWHRTRIAVKELRYALEFAGAACPNPVEAARAATLLARWQDVLGTAQDLETARQAVAGILGVPGVAAGDATRAIALVDGWSARTYAEGEAPGPRGGRRAIRAVHAALRPAGHDSGPPQPAPANRARPRRVR